MRQSTKSLPYAAIASAARREFSAKQCLHPEADPQKCGKVIGAHTIQRAGAIRQLSDASNHVLTFYPIERSETNQPKVHRRGWKEASVFYGFCSNHDGSTFVALEQLPFVGSAEQCFLIAYRAHCHELYQKLASQNATPTVIELAARGLRPELQARLRHDYSLIAAGVEKALAELHQQKEAMDRSLLGKDYSSWNRIVIEFDGEISVAGTAAITPNVDFHGNCIQVLHDPDAHIYYLYLGVVPRETGGAMVFTWRAEDSAISQYIDSLQRLDTIELPHICAQIMFAFCENTYFSSAWWESLDARVRNHLTELAINPNPGYSRLTFLQESVVPWKVSKTIRE